MSLDILIIQLVALSCIFTVLRGGKARGWSWVATGILGILLLGIIQKASWTAWVTGALWCLGILLPVQGLRYINWLRSQENYGTARIWALVMRWLHPLDGWWVYPDILKALLLAKQGDRNQALHLLNRYQGDLSFEGRWAKTLAYQLETRWQDYLIWIHRTLSETQRLQEPAVMLMYLRSLGETGDLNQLVRVLDRCDSIVRRSGNSSLLSYGRLFAFAFAGQPDMVQALFAKPLCSCSATTKQFWLATADWFAGHPEQARSQFAELRQQPDANLQAAITWRLTQPYKHPDRTLTLASYEILNRFRQEMYQEAKYDLQQWVPLQQAPVTYGLVALNLLIFALPWIVEIGLSGFIRFEHELANLLGLPPDLTWVEQLFTPFLDPYGWGVMVPDRVLAGEWWRLLSATFLHLGVIHLTMNMLGLAFVGTFVESRIGSWSFLWIYLFSGVGSMAIVAGLSIEAGTGTIGALGASGAIMGVLGVMGAIFLQGWRKHRERVAGRWLRTFGVIVTLQTIFDALNPQVSMMGHLSGLVLGFVTGWLLLQRRSILSTPGSSLL